MKHTLILGAGASREFFEPQLTTEALSRYLLDETAWHSILDCYNHRPRYAAQINSVSLATLLGRIAALNPCNFEHSIDLLDQACSYYVTSSPGRYALHDLLVL